MYSLPEIDFKYLRDQIVGIDTTFKTPYGDRLMVYCDYTASGRCLKFIEKYIANLQRNYANTHTEDDITGRSMTQILHQAEAHIKDSVNAGPDGRIISVGTGSTAAIDKFQQIIGVALPPASALTLHNIMTDFMGDEKTNAYMEFLKKQRPVIFIGAYEHHSNELTWRENLCTVVRVKLAQDGAIDLEHLEALLQKPEHQNRLRIGSFSAASNVSGLISPVQELTSLLHRYDALACFDYAASAPYVNIDMNPKAAKDGTDTSIDAIFISPHKFLGGPGSSGVLVFNKRIYNTQIAPSVSGGGTVDYVSPGSHDFIADIEEREKAGTPGVLQIMKAALAIDVKEAIAVENIEKRELELLYRAFAKWIPNPNIDIMGNQDPVRRVAIVSFNIKDNWGRFLHPKFVTVLLNDLFGIQSRAGCSCAGPYGHSLLGIDEETSQKYRKAINQGNCGLKPGWCRIGFHYVMDNIEADYIINAIDFVAQKGYLFLKHYDFNMNTATWKHTEDQGIDEEFTLKTAISCRLEESNALPSAIRERIYNDYLREAGELADKLAIEGVKIQPLPEGELGELQFFSIPK
ncbi:aminotransferase class V-fold PLP-dependent enzyme [bacterium]|nr:aminotransferase class V-fold PLP-dependent enzyme [bacterium]